MSQFNHVTPVWLCRATAAAALAIALGLLRLPR